MEQTFAGTVKIIFLGDSGVGKSAVLWRYNNQATSFDSYSFTTTLGVDYFSTTKRVGGSVFKICLWDTAGQERFRTVIPSYFKGANGVVFVFDMTDRQTFEDVRYWHEYFRSKSSSNPADVPFLILGNKSDLERSRKVPAAEAGATAAELGAQYLEVSAKTGENVHTAIDRIVQMAVKADDAAAPELEPVVIPDADADDDDGRSCCPK